jgi:hypothetical protein
VGAPVLGTLINYVQVKRGLYGYGYGYGYEYGYGKYHYGSGGGSKKSAKKS